MQFRLTLKCTHCYRDVAEFPLDTAWLYRWAKEDADTEITAALEEHRREECPFCAEEFRELRRKL